MADLNRPVLFARLNPGDDLLEGIRRAAERYGVRSGLVWAIGTLREARLGFFVGGGTYKPIHVAGPLEIASCIGNIAEKSGEALVHAHLVVSDGEGRAYGGHLLDRCIIGVTGEVAIMGTPEAKLSRKLDQTTGLFLLDL